MKGWPVVRRTAPTCTSAWATRAEDAAGWKVEDIATFSGSVGGSEAAT